MSRITNFCNLCHAGKTQNRKRSGENIRIVSGHMGYAENQKEIFAFIFGLFKYRTEKNT